MPPGIVMKEVVVCYSGSQQTDFRGLQAAHNNTTWRREQKGRQEGRQTNRQTNR